MRLHGGVRTGLAGMLAAAVIAGAAAATAAEQPPKNGSGATVAASGRLPAASAVFETSASFGAAAGPNASAGVKASATDHQAELVAREDDRLARVHALIVMGTGGRHARTTPFEVATDGARTVVLTKRTKPYTLGELASLAPGAVTTSEGALLVRRSIVVASGATLRVTEAQVRLLSEPAVVTSIVGDGGSVVLAGTAQHPVTVTSWNEARKAPDADVADGRAYVRSMGGRMTLDSVRLQDLGFWSGRTGGLALTGHPRVDRPQRPRPPTPSPSGAPANATSPTGTATRTKGTSTRGTPAPPSAAPPRPTSGVPLVDATSGSHRTGWASGEIRDTRISGCVYGLFVSGARSLSVTDTSVTSSAVDGVHLHGATEDVTLRDVTSSSNTGNGLTVARGATRITVTGSAFADNTADGIALAGGPAADGPNAAGSGTSPSGQITVDDTRVADNGRYGVLIDGAHDVAVKSSTVERSSMGIVVRGDAGDIRVEGNTVSQPDRYGILVADGPSKVTVDGNAVTGGGTGLVVRSAGVQASGNTLSGASAHAVTVVGPAEGVRVTGNTLVGHGERPIDDHRAQGLSADAISNDTSRWEVKTPPDRVVRRVLGPLTVMWLLLAAVLVLTPSRRRRGKRRGGEPVQRRDPYPHSRPLTD